MKLEKRNFNDAKTNCSAAPADNEIERRANSIVSEHLEDLVPHDKPEVKGGEFRGQTVRVQFRSTTDSSL